VTAFANLIRMSDRRLATLASLAGLTLLVYAMVAVRVVYTGGFGWSWLYWNLILAWVPLGIALLLYDAARRGASGLPLLAGGAVWLLFFPNAPYIVTDLKHLRTFDGAPIWFDTVIACSAAWAGLALGFISLYLMQSVVRKRFGPLNGWFFALAVLAVSSFGIYLGRFERWNSWDLVTRPDALLADVWTLAEPRTAAVTVLFTAFLGATYLVFYSFARAGLLEPTDH
jgi:uncharacterized membrane protein